MAAPDEFVDPLQAVTGTDDDFLNIFGDDPGGVRSDNKGFDDLSGLDTSNFGFDLVQNKLPNSKLVPSVATADDFAEISF